MKFIHVHHFTILYLLERTSRCFLNFSPTLCGATYLRITQLPRNLSSRFVVFNNNNSELTQEDERGKTTVDLV